MIDKEKKNKIADILLDFYEEYHSNEINRPMIPSIYAGKIIDSLQEEPKSKFKVGQTITDPTDSTFTFHINKIEDGRYIEKEDEWVLVKEADANYELVEEPVSIWHDSNKEQPNFASAVAIWNPKYKNGEIISRCTQVYSDRIWAYIDDLLKI